MAYTKQTWADLPSKTTPINATRLTHIEDGIFNAAATADNAASTAGSLASRVGIAEGKITNLEQQKVDKETGKGLSENDFTNTLKSKLDGIASGAEVNVQSDWDEDDSSSDAFILNKPTLGTASTKNSTSVVTDSTDLVESGAVKAYIDDLHSHRIYGFHIKTSESDPDNMVTYLADAVDATPAHMDYTNDVFDYGTWENAFFMPKPCMLKSDGTVAYYLNPEDYTKKADGTASDVANTAFDGNAMMEWGRDGKKIWTKIVPDEHGEGASVFIANYKADNDFHDWSFHNSAGVSVDHFYTPIYNGSVISNKMRSLSGQQVSKKLAGEQEITAAKLNNPGSDEMWNTECFADRLLINMLLILMSKTVDTQTAFGQGLNASGSEAINDAFRTGVHNDKGLFYGTNSGAAATYSNAVKIFGMENWWGFQWRRIRGLILSDGAFKAKLTYGQEDGSTVTGYNTDGAGYINQGLATPSGTSGSYIISHSFTKDGMFPKTLDGSQTTYYCDAFWYNNSGARFAFCGGVSNVGAKVGAFCLVLNYAVSVADWNSGAALSCKPLAQG